MEYKYQILQNGKLIPITKDEYDHHLTFNKHMYTISYDHAFNMETATLYPVTK